MADLMYHNIFFNMMTAGIDFTNTSGDVLLLALMATGHSASTVDDAAWADVSGNEVTGSGYTAAGKTITANTITPRDDDTDNTAVLDITEDVTWTPSTISAYYAVLYDGTPTTPTADPLICSFDFGGVKSSSGGDFTIQFSATPTPGAVFTVG